MKTIYITIIAISTLCISCISHKNIVDNSQQKYTSIWKGQIKQISKKQIYEVSKEKGFILFGKSNELDSAIYYISDNGKLLAGKFQTDQPSFFTLQKRYSQMKGLYNESDMGFKILSLDSVSGEKNWAYAIEYIQRKETDRNIYFWIETSLNRRIYKAIIVTDEEHRKVAIGLMDAFTKELMNVKLNLEANLK